MATAEFWKWVMTFSALFVFAVALLFMIIFKVFKNYEEDRRIREEGGALDPDDFGSNKYRGAR